MARIASPRRGDRMAGGTAGPGRKRWTGLLAIVAVFALQMGAAGTVARTAGCLSGTTRLATPPLPPRVQHALLADDVGHLYVFGGFTRITDPATGRVADGPALNDFWRYDIDLGRWTALPTAGGPPPLVEPHLARDRAGFIYEFGGVIISYEEGPFSDQLYRYDPVTERWTQLNPSGPRPPGRTDYGFVWEPISDQIYLFAGSTDDGEGGERALNDFWRYDPRTGRWFDLTLASGADAIEPREIYNLSADGRGSLYLFAGSVPIAGIGWSAVQDFWRYDVARGRWENITASTNTKDVPARHYYGQAVDRAGNFYVVGGVRAGQTVPLGDAWRFNPWIGRWENVTSLFGPAMLPLIPYNLVYDPSSNALFTVGGMTSGTEATNDVYRTSLCELSQTWRVLAPTLLTSGRP